MLLDRQKGNDMQLAIKKLSLYKLYLIFSGIGIAMVLSSLIVSIYYNMINAWAFHYLFSSMSASLPWLNCDNKWNDPDRK